MVSNQRPGRRDFFALEVVDGTLVALFNFGTKQTQRFVLGTGVDDGQPHRVRISRDGRNVVLVLDNEEQHDIIDSEINDLSLDLGSLVSITALRWRCSCKALIRIVYLRLFRLTTHGLTFF